MWAKVLKVNGSRDTGSGGSVTKNKYSTRTKKRRTRALAHTLQLTLSMCFNLKASLEVTSLFVYKINPEQQKFYC